MAGQESVVYLYYYQAQFLLDYYGNTLDIVILPRTLGCRYGTGNKDTLSLPQSACTEMKKENH